MRVLIIGAGVAGLAAATALRSDGHDVTVAEQSPVLRTSGAAVTLWSNGTGILDDLGVSLDGVGAPIDTLEQWGEDGRRLITVDVGRAARALRHPHICLPRRRLLERLADALPDGTVEFGRDCTGIAQEGETVQVFFAGGPPAGADLVVGADGRRSAVRGRLWDRDPAEPSGWGTWQGLTPVPIDVTASRRGLTISGRAGSCGLMPAGEGLLQWWFDMPWNPDEPPPASPLSEIRRRFGHWCPPVPDVLKAAREEDVEFFPHYGHRVPRTWGTGRVTLAGDSAHTFPPARAQGANQALEDAWTLATVLRSSSAVPPDVPADVPAALREYERRRARKAGIVARHSGTEDVNKYRPFVSRLVPDGLAGVYYTRWLAQISDFLG